MSLLAGTNIGPYRIVSLIGAGGMGEVYKATDTRLNRTVAIKVLPAHFSQNTDMKQRFEREAQTIGALNHPHICTLYDVGRDQDVDFLVMEYLEGETLAQRLERGALPLTEALTLAVEIADALDKAHGLGIVHRDLKPSNVMLTKSGAKLLDFGLAKLKAVDRSAGVSTLPTRTDMTAQGQIVGTMQYMAPEQLEGKDADSRTDIFAFGALLYEMLSGRKAFAGSSQAGLISSIMSAEPQPVSAVQPLTPPAVDHLIRICLAKDPEQRWQTARDIAVHLKWIIEGGSSIGIPAPVASQRRRRERLAWMLFAVAALFVIAMTVPAYRYFSPAEPLEIRFEIASLDTLPGTSALYILTISPDARWIVFGDTGRAFTPSLFVRAMNSTVVREIPGAQAAAGAFWSPDSQRIAFVGSGKLKTISINGGPPQDICDAPQYGGGTWNGDGTIIFSSRGVLHRVPAAGGAPQVITQPDNSGEEFAHGFPWFLPDGRHYLFLSQSRNSSERRVYAGSLDSDVRTPILDVASPMIYAEPGYVFYHRGGTLFTQEFDAGNLKLTGQPILVADRTSFSAISSAAAFSASQNGTLIYRTVGTTANRRFFWVDRLGKEIGQMGEPGSYVAFDLSPDEKTIAVSHGDSSTANRDIWLIDSRGVRTRLTFDLSSETDVIWSADGLNILFNTLRNGTPDIFQKRASGVGEETEFLATNTDEWIEDWSKDGRYVAYVTTSQIAVLPTFGDRKPIRITQGPFLHDEPRFSPDTKWLAYNSDESGTWQVYVASFPALDNKFQVSTAGGAQPRWKGDGKELYYLDLEGKMMAVDLQSRVPRVLFNTGLSVDPIRDQHEVTADGQKFLLLKSIAGAETPGISVIVNWPVAFKK